MPRLYVSEFDGLVPRTGPHALADNQAQVALNTKLYAHELRAWRDKTWVADLPTGTDSIKSIYKLYDYSGNAKWLQWPFPDVDVALSSVSDNTDIRFYMTGFGNPKQSNWLMAYTPGLWGSGTFQQLGVPAPTGAPTLAATVAGTGALETRAYVYTFVNTFGAVTQESPPSPPTSVTVGTVGSTVTISGMDGAPVAALNITARRIYRTVTGNSSVTYEFVAEIPIATASYADTLTVAQLGGALQTETWALPPTNMLGIVNLGSSGVLAGFDGNTVCLSEPFYPHAWPVEYRLTVPFRVIGLGTIGSSLVVMTERFPYIISGGIPGAMSVEKVPILEPCVSRKSVVSLEDGVVYASPNGLVTIGSAGRGNTVRALYRRDEWQALQPQYITGTVLDGRYIGCFTGGPKAGKAIILDPADKPSLCELEVPNVVAVHTDSKDAKLYFVDTASLYIYQVDADAALLPYTWTSKKWHIPGGELSWSACRVRAEHGAGALTLKLYAAGALVATINPADDKPFRLPAFRAREFYFELTGTRAVSSVTFATSMSELGA